MSSEHDANVLDAIFNPIFPLEENNQKDVSKLKDLDDDDASLAPFKKSMKFGIDAAESGDLEKALSIFTQVIEGAPHMASGYNNRAQVYRCRGEIKEAKMDLTKAIELSGGHGRSACQALCQMGLIYWKEGNTESAKESFKAAEELGSQFAKLQLVKLNPYAALCNQMLQTVFENLYS